MTKKKIQLQPKDVEDCLLQRELEGGIIRLYESIEGYSAQDFDTRLKYVMDSGVKNITILISSPGGSVYDALGIYDSLMEARKKAKVNGVVTGYAASAAAMILLQACTVRKCYPNARILFHEPKTFRFYSEERKSDTEDTFREMKAITDIVVDIIAERANKSPKEIFSLFERKELWLSAQEALQLGLIDEIIR